MARRLNYKIDANPGYNNRALQAIYNRRSREQQSFKV